MSTEMSGPGEPADSVPEEVAAFVVAHVRSVRDLEALLQLLKEPGAAWSARKLAQELRSNADAVERCLAAWCEAGILKAAGEGAPRTYALNLEDARLQGVLSNLRAFYGIYPLRIIELIYSGGRVEKIREFADAFRLKVPPKDEDPS
jgi:hypothetical protein